MKLIHTVFLVLFLSISLVAAASVAGGNAAILPQQFAGWVVSGSSLASKDPAKADPVNAALLKEYGFTDFASANYLRDDGRKLSIKAARFQDASGAYGAFSYYKMPQMRAEQIGDQAASLNERVLFYRGNILVDAEFEKLTAMSAAELRDLASSLPLPRGNAGNPPPLPGYLPKNVSNTAKYIVGPAGLQKVAAPISADAVDFPAGAEAVVGTCPISAGTATLMLINYPTNQIAAEHLRRLEAAHNTNDSHQPGSAVNLNPFFDKRTGPIVAVVSGPLSQSEAQSILGSINYEADVTWNENTHFTKRDNLANLLVNIIILCGIVIVFAAVAGLAFGGVRVLVKKFLPERIFDRPEEAEFIALHLSEAAPLGSDSKVNSSIKRA
jgi:hypothetical protein